MKTKIISIILTVAIAVTGFTVKSSAAFDPTIVTDLLKAIGLVTAGAVAGSAAMGLGDCLAEVVEDGVDTWYNDTLPNKVVTNANAVFYNEGIGVTYNSALNSYQVTVNSSLTGDDLEYATILADKLNNYPLLDSMITSIGSPVGGVSSHSLEVAFYEDLKSIIGQTTTEFTYKKGQEYAVANGIALENNGAIPVYDFNFVGPIPSIDMPEHYTMANEYMLDGYVLTRPFVLNSTDAPLNIYGVAGIPKANMEELAKKYGLVDYGANYGYVLGDTALNGGMYIIYNNEIFSNPCATGKNVSYQLTTATFEHFKNADGVYLKDVISMVDAQYLPRGFYEKRDENASDYIVGASEFSQDNFTIATGGTTIDIPRTDDEQAISDGIDLGIIDENGNIVLDEDGNIVSIDGLNIDKLMQLIQQIADNGSISFDSVEEYLAEISRLLRLANVDSAAMNTVIANLKELEKAQSKDISEINANVAAIAEALAASKEITADKTFEIETPSTIIDKFPFSLPFDLHKAFNILSAEPQAPSFEIPLKMEGVFDYSIDIDLSEYEFIAEICRGLLYAIFIVGLILATNKLIGRG